MPRRAVSNCYWNKMLNKFCNISHSLFVTWSRETPMQTPLISGYRVMKNLSMLKTISNRRIVCKYISNRFSDILLIPLDHVHILRNVYYCTKYHNTFEGVKIKYIACYDLNKVTYHRNLLKWLKISLFITRTHHFQNGYPLQNESAHDY